MSAGARPAMSAPELFERLTGLLEHYRLDDLVALSDERALIRAWDRLLKRQVALRVHLTPDSPGRQWFLRETETLAQLDHPSIRHVYDAHLAGPYAYRTTNWIEGESLADAMRRGPRAIPHVMSLARDLLSALEHAHARGVIVRRIVPGTLMLEISGRGVVTDLRYASCCFDFVPEADAEGRSRYVAPELRDRPQPGEPAADVYTVSAILYYALTGIEPPADPDTIQPPRALRPACPAALERVLLRGLRRNPQQRFFTATEMLEDFVSDAGGYHEPAAAPPAAAVATPGDAAGGDQWEKRLRRSLGDDYELLAELGSGGFGRVYRVRDLGLEREVALKVLHPALTADQAVVERFRREAQLAARLRHPNIVAIHEIGGRAGLLWYTMELIPGHNLAQLVQRDGPWLLEQTVRMLREALTALHHAHLQGLVHRDIKPENMLIDQDGRLRITDFGLALALREAGRFGGATSRSGTPAFASPEQLLGERVDHRSDLYSLGAVAYFVLLGRPPFEGKTPEAILARQTTGGAPPLAPVRSDISPAVEQVLSQAVASDPSARFASAAEFGDALTLATRRDIRDWGIALMQAAEGWVRRVTERGPPGGRPDGPPGGL